ncbi:MAG: hypothetical protein ACTSSG_09105 [Candidatus Heimdallarchaeaceae archaeon]
MTTKDTYLCFKLEKAIARIKTHSGYNNSPLFLEICNCPSKGGSLYYDTKKQTYFGKGSCHKGLLCSKIQIDKHQVLIRRTRPALFSEDLLTEQKVGEQLVQRTEPKIVIS